MTGGLINPFKKHKKPDGQPAFNDEYEVHEEIGRGGFAVVYRAHKRGQELGMDVAVRMCPIKTALTSHAPYVMTIETLRTKMDSAKKMSVGTEGSKYILTFLDYRITSTDLITMTELCTGGDCFDRILLQKTGHFTEDDARQFAKNLCLVIAGCHERGVIHRDIKPENILYTKPDSPNYDLRLTDFGCCLPYCKRDELYEGGPVGSPGYLAPEMIAGQKYNMLVDEWSAGITIYEALTGRSPLISQTPEDLNKETLERAIPYPRTYWAKHSPEAKDFVQRLLQKDPKRRMSAEEALEHPWLTGKGESDGKPLASSESTSSSETDGMDRTESLVGRKTKRTELGTSSLMAHVTSHHIDSGLAGSENFDASAILEGRLSADHTTRLQAMDSGYASASTSSGEMHE